MTHHCIVLLRLLRHESDICMTQQLRSVWHIIDLCGFALAGLLSLLSLFFFRVFLLFSYWRSTPPVYRPPLFVCRALHVSPSWRLPSSAASGLRSFRPLFFLLSDFRPMLIFFSRKFFFIPETKWRAPLPPSPSTGAQNQNNY